MTFVTTSKIKKSHLKIRRPQWECCTFALDNEVKCDCGLRQEVAGQGCGLRGDAREHSGVFGNIRHQLFATQVNVEHRVALYVHHLHEIMHVVQCLGYNKLIPFPFAHTRFSGS